MINATHTISAAGLLAQIDLGTTGLVGGILFFLVFALVAYIAFRLLRRTVKMAFRIAIVAVILAVAAIGGISLYWFGSSGGNKATPQKPSPTRAR